MNSLDYIVDYSFLYNKTLLEGSFRYTLDSFPDYATKLKINMNVLKAMGVPSNKKNLSKLKVVINQEI